MSYNKACGKTKNNLNPEVFPLSEYIYISYLHTNYSNGGIVPKVEIEILYASLWK